MLYHIMPPTFKKFSGHTVNNIKFQTLFSFFRHQAIELYAKPYYAPNFDKVQWAYSK